MYAFLNLRRTISLMLMFFCATLFAQDVEKKPSIGDEIYQEYQQNGIDNAIQKYQELKANNPSEYHWDEWELNRIGYMLMEEGDHDAAEKVFRLNMEEYPDAANPRDSFADYLLEKGDKEQAKKYLQEAISLGEKNDLEEEQSILMGSRAKLARLENKDRQLDFLLGNWDVDSNNFEDGMETGALSGKDEFLYNEDSTMVSVIHRNEADEIIGQRIIVYDPMDEAYDMAFINGEYPMGIETSSIKVKELGEGKHEFMEEYTNRNGEKKKMKHELVMAPNGEIEWLIFESGDTEQDWKKVYVMNMKKRN